MKIQTSNFDQYDVVYNTLVSSMTCIFLVFDEINMQFGKMLQVFYTLVYNDTAKFIARNLLDNIYFERYGNTRTYFETVYRVIRKC